MSLGIPAHLAPAIFAKSLSRLFLVYALTCLILSAVLLLIAAQVEQSLVTLGSALFIAVPIIILVMAVGQPPSRARALAYLLVVSAALALAAYASLGPAEYNFNTAFTPLAFMSFATAMVCAAATTVWERMLWLTVGYLSSQIVLITVAVMTSKDFAFDWRVFAGTVIAGAAIVWTPRLLAVSTRAQESIDHTSELVQEEDFRSQATREATMVVHDTLLATLSALALTKPGPLPTSMMLDVEHQLASMHSSNWVAQAIHGDSSEKHQKWSQALLDVMSSAESQGLQINVSGQADALDKLSEESAEALLAALAQCLTNVMQHSGQTSAEVVVLATDDSVTVTVIDNGVGFDSDAVPEDRLGLRLSVHGRMEAVGGTANVWTGHDVGTAVMLRAPRQSTGVNAND